LLVDEQQNCSYVSFMALTGIPALKRACEVLKSQSEVARVVGVSSQAVSEICRQGRRVPAEWCLKIEAATRALGETITAHQLRPDLYPAPPKRKPDASTPAPKPGRGPKPRNPAMAEAR
jgi:DNA-binding transcriptional regulator YdaS (Cro superfamily)